MVELVGLDFETYSGTDLTVHGQQRYMADPTFQPLIGSACVAHRGTWSMDFIRNQDTALEALESYVKDNWVVAHNASFEEGVLNHFGLADAPKGYVDSAVIARVHGANGSLAAAARQLLNSRKMEEGMDLIRLFSIPGKYQEENGSLEFDSRVVDDNPEKWDTFDDYCRKDSMLCLDLQMNYTLTGKEQSYNEVTNQMNKVGWPVDRESVEEMYARYLENQLEALEGFRGRWGDVNLNSLKQQKEFCFKHGIKTSSFDEKSVQRLHKLILKKLDSNTVIDPLKVAGYHAVLDMLNTKMILGGSSLKKLKVILDTIVEDQGVWRLKGQYLHCGAGQTLRTTGRSVQMQNLKRIGGHPSDMDELVDPDIHWTNDELAANIRQCFTSKDPKGLLIVGDFSSIESRGLAYLAGEDWKLDAYRNGTDLYKMLATKFYGVDYDSVTKGMRLFGKVGELSCQYQAGPDAVESFAAGMGAEITNAEAGDLVNNWRAENPAIVQFWDRLNDAMHQCISQDVRTSVIVGARGNMVLNFSPIAPPSSLRSEFTVAEQSLLIELISGTGETIMSRVFHGVHEHGRNLRYFKPSKRKTGPAWVENYIDPKTGQLRYYELYGGKLAGILTQSFCREIFFDRLWAVSQWCETAPNVDLIGQFHDEIVLDWVPDGHNPVSLDHTTRVLNSYMSEDSRFPDFPMAAEVGVNYRYTK